MNRRTFHSGAGDEPAVELVNGCGYVFPARLVKDLRGASPADLARVDVEGVGFNLHSPALDVDLYVPALLAGIFGTGDWMTRVRPEKSSAGSAGSPRRPR